MYYSCFIRGKFILLILLMKIIFLEFTAGITTGLVNSSRLKLKFENGSVSPENYQYSHSQHIVLPKPSQLNPVYTSSVQKPSLPYKKGKAEGRNGINVEKTPPDLQFGLAFTVPFISLSTDRLLSTVSGQRGYNSLSDIMSILKLNVGGVVLAAVVGVAALLFLPAIFTQKGGSGFGGLSKLFHGNFMPGILDSIVPGLGIGGINKPLGFGQYDNTIYNEEYGNNLPYGINRKDNEGRSRSLNENQENGTSVFNEIANVVGDYLGQAQTCALYTMCTRGRDEKRTSNSGGHRDGRKIKLSTFDHAIEVIHGVSDDVPGLGQFKEAYNIGQSDKIDCSSKYKECNVENSKQVINYINNIGEFIFS